MIINTKKYYERDYKVAKKESLQENMKPTEIKSHSSKKEYSTY